MAPWTPASRRVRLDVLELVLLRRLRAAPSEFVMHKERMATLPDGGGAASEHRLERLVQRPRKNGTRNGRSDALKAVRGLKLCDGRSSTCADGRIFPAWPAIDLGQRRRSRRQSSTRRSMRHRPATAHRRRPACERTHFQSISGNAFCNILRSVSIAARSSLP